MKKMYEVEYFETSGWTMKKVYDKETMLKEVKKMFNSHLVKEYRVSVIDEENNKELIHYRKKQGGQAEVMITNKWEALEEQTLKGD